MADNLKVWLNALYSENADYSDPQWTIDDAKWAAYEIDPTEKMGPTKVNAVVNPATAVVIAANSAACLCKVAFVQTA